MPDIKQKIHHFHPNVGHVFLFDLADYDSFAMLVWINSIMPLTPTIDEKGALYQSDDKKVVINFGTDFKFVVQIKDNDFAMLFKLTWM